MDGSVTDQRPSAQAQSEAEIHDQFLRDCGGVGTLLGVFLVVFDVFAHFLGFENIVGGAQSVVNGIRKYRRRSPKRSKWDSKISSAEPKA